MLFTLTVLLTAAVLLVPLVTAPGARQRARLPVGGAHHRALRLSARDGRARHRRRGGTRRRHAAVPDRARSAPAAALADAARGVRSRAAQVAVTARCWPGLLVLIGVSTAGAIVLGAGLALSSTAIVLPMLGERDLLGTPAGRSTFSVLLFQDLAFVPLVAAVPLLAGTGLPQGVPWLQVARAVAAIAVILLGGRFLVRPVFRAVGGTRTPEVFTVLALLVVVGTAALASAAGLSTSLGAFLAGVLLSDSEYRHEVKATIDPFEGLLLGFFFLSVGMQANLGLAAADPLFFAIAVPALVLVKIARRLRAHGRRPQPTPRAPRAFRLRSHRAANSASCCSQPPWPPRRSTQPSRTVQRSPSRCRWPRPRCSSPISSGSSCRGSTRSHSAILRPDRGRRRSGDHLRFRPRGTDRRAHSAHAWHRVHGARTGYDPARRRAPLRPEGLLWRSDPAGDPACGWRGARARSWWSRSGDVEASLAAVDVARRNFPDLRIVVRARNRQHAYLLMDRGITA